MQIMQTMNEKSPFASLVAGQLYAYQSNQVLPEDKNPDAISAVLVKTLAGQKAPEHLQEKAKEFIDEAQETYEKLIEDQFEDESEDEAVLNNFWETIVTQYNTAADDAAKLAASATIGRFLFLVDSDAQNTALIVRSDKAQNLLALSVAQKLQEARKALDVAVAAKQAYGIVTESNEIRAGLLPTAMAKALITSTRIVNTAIIDDVKAAFFLNGELENQTEISAVLAKLAERGECLQLLNETVAPEDSSVASWEVLLAMLELPADSELSDKDATVCALSACLSQVTDTYGKLLKQVNLARFLSDINTLLETGSLERNIEGLPEKVTFSLDGNSSPLQKTLSTSVNGSITNNWFQQNQRLWQVHGIIDACKAMEIKSEDVESTCKAALKSLGGEKPAKRFNVTAKEVILAMANADVKRANVGYMAFTAAYKNLAVCAWQNALKSMQTIRPQTEHLARMHNAVREALFTKFTDKDIHNRAALGRIFSDFVVSLPKKLAADCPTNAQALQAFVLRVLPDADPKLAAVVEYIKSDDFATCFAQKYDAVKSPWNKEQALDATSFARTYRGSDSNLFEAKDAHALFAALVEHSKDLAFLGAPRQALLFTPGAIFTDSNVKPFWDKFAKQTTATMDLMVRDEKSRKEIFTWIQENILDEVTGVVFMEDTSTVGKKLTFTDFRKELQARILFYLTGSETIAEADKEKLAGVALANSELDNLFATMLHNKKSELAVPFATAMHDVEGTKPGYVLYHDPITNVISIGMKKGDNFVRLNQDEWFEGDWEFGQLEAAAQ